MAMRVASRRALLLIQRHQREGGSKQQQQQQPWQWQWQQRRQSKKAEEAPWPDSIKYPFYALCVISIPVMFGQALALSPRLREYVLGDDALHDVVFVVDSDASSPTSTSTTDPPTGTGWRRTIMSRLREYWGHDEYVPPVDVLPKLIHDVSPGRRKMWREDDYSSLLDMFGMYDRRGTRGEYDDDDRVLVVRHASLDNEPPYRVRCEQANLMRNLNDPDGVLVRLRAYTSTDDDDDDSADDPIYETECTLPAGVSVSSLRDAIVGSDARQRIRDLSDHGVIGAGGEFHSRSSYERIRTRGWNEGCRWAVTFPEADERNDDYNSMADDAVARAPVSGEDSSSSSSTSAAAAVALNLRRNTAIHSSWTHHPGGLASASVAIAAPLASSMGSASPPISSSSADGNSLRVQGLQYQISILERDLVDPSCMRDRDDMREELRMARGELRSLRPWWRRGWGW